MHAVSGERRFAALPERVFELLIDPDVVISALPAVRGHRVIDRDHWQAKVKPPVPFAPSITIKFEVVEREPGERAALRAQGGGADVTSTFELAADDDGTLMRWEAKLQLAGILGRLAGSGLDGIAQRQANRMLDAVERAL
jgi:carbon monoxide dehydrogenase subunit G